MNYSRVNNILCFIGIVFTITLIYSCNSNAKWLKARIVYYDNFEEELYVKAGKRTYYNFVKGKTTLKSKKKYLIPEEVKLVETYDNPSRKYMRMYFDEETYGMESYSFGHSLAGDSLMIVETKYQVKTCACKTSGTYFKDYFLVYNDSILKIKTDNKNNVYNRGKIYDFIEQYSDYGMPQDINTIEDIIFFLENINN